MRSTFRGLVLFAALIFCVFWIHCGKDKGVDSGDNVSNTDFVAADSFSFEVEIGVHTRLSLEGINGNITITGLSGANSIIIEGERRVGSESTQDAEEHLQELEVSVTDMQSYVRVRTIQPDHSHGRSYVVDYTITLPQELEVVVANVNGIIVIDSASNSVTVANVNGQITLDEIFGSTSVQLVNGQIQAEVTLPADGVIGMSTVNGGIGLGIPQNTSAEFAAAVVNGTITISDLILKNPTSTANSLTGTLGDGQGTISLSTVNGTISVSGF
jgi:hypothetical protein